MLKVNFPSKVIRLSSSVILICQNPHPSPAIDYQLLLLRRNSKISFGNYYTFPGGGIEKQDYTEKWRNQTPKYFEAVGSKY